MPVFRTERRDVLKYWEGERGSFPGTCAGLTGEVASGYQSRNRLTLNGRWFFVAELSQGLDKRDIEAEPRESLRCVGV